VVFIGALGVDRIEPRVWMFLGPRETITPEDSASQSSSGNNRKTHPAERAVTVWKPPVKVVPTIREATLRRGREKR